MEKLKSNIPLFPLLFFCCVVGCHAPKITQRSNDTVQKLKTTSIPELAFDNAEWIDIVEFLYFCISGMSMPPITLYGGKDICIFVIPIMSPCCPEPKNVIRQRNRAVGDSLIVNYTPFTHFGKFSCKFENITLYDAYLQVAQLCDGHVDFYNDLVLLSAPIPLHIDENQQSVGR